MLDDLTPEDDWLAEWLDEGRFVLPPGDVDEFQHHLTDAMTERFDGPGRQAGYGETPFPHDVVRPNATTDTVLWIAFEADTKEMWLAIAGPAAALQRDRPRWLQVLNDIRSALGQSGRPFLWSAIVGADPGLVGHPAVRFTDSFAIGPFAVQLPTKPLHEYRSTVARYRSIESVVSWPVIVEGTTNTFAWEAAHHRTAADLRVVAALLSVAAGEPWRLRYGPQLRQPAIAGEIPDGPLTFAGEESMPPVRPEDRPTEPIEPPAWLAGSWEAVESDDALRRALLVHHEGLLLAIEHPSFAGIAQVAALDTIGERHSKKNWERVKWAAGMGLESAAEVEQLMDTVYKSRHGTAHEGILHADEALGGVFAIPTFGSVLEGPGFALSTLRLAERAVRNMLVNQLSTFVDGR